MAEADDGLLAFARAGFSGLPHPEARPTHTELRGLYVAQAAQGRGLGTRLPGLALAWMEAHGDGPMWIGGWSGNEKAKKLYAAHGFREVGAYRYAVGTWFDDERILRRG